MGQDPDRRGPCLGRQGHPPPRAGRLSNSSGNCLHARAQKAEDTDWKEIALLYRLLERLQPSPVVTLNRAVAVSKAEGPAAALKLLEPLDEQLSNYFYYHGVRGGLLKKVGASRDAREAFNRAIALANSPAEAAHIREHLDQLEAEALSYMESEES